MTSRGSSRDGRAASVIVAYARETRNEHTRVCGLYHRPPTKRLRCSVSPSDGSARKPSRPFAAATKTISRGCLHSSRRVFQSNNIDVQIDKTREPRTRRTHDARASVPRVRFGAYGFNKFPLRHSSQNRIRLIKLRFFRGPDAYPPLVI